jgi:V/A-type H+-transporting ATPase subunit D
MATLKLSKSALQEQRNQLRLLEKLLPSLDLKRRQLLLELNKAQQTAQDTRAAITALDAGIGARLPMLAAGVSIPAGLVQMRAVRVGTENVAGVKVPRLEGVECAVAAYSLLATPAWVDRLVDQLQVAAELRARLRIAEERVTVLERALRRITQRVNLFGRVLIPEARQNIRRIRIYLGDLEREGVIRSKLSKARRLQPPATAGAVPP